MRNFVEKLDMAVLKAKMAIAEKKEAATSSW